LQLGVVLAESIEEKNSVEVVAIKWADSEDSYMKGVNFFNHLAHWGAWTETSVEGFGDECNLGVSAKVLVVLVEGSDNGGGSGKAGNNLVVSAQDVLKHKCLQ